MVKIVDLDKLFDKYISEYVYKNIGKINPDAIEDNIPILYEKFGNERLSELDGNTPNNYYKEFSAKQLIEAAKGYIYNGVPVSDFLSSAIMGQKDADVEIINALREEKEDKFILYLLNIYLNLKSDKYLSEILGFIIYDFSADIKELAKEILMCNVEKIKDEILELFDDAEDEKKEYLLEILLNSVKDDRIFSLLISEFKRNSAKTAQYANYLAKYGDERAIPVLIEKIENPKTGYAEFTELRFAIECLGGEYAEERDFSNDKDYRKIKGAKGGKIL